MTTDGQETVAFSSELDAFLAGSIDVGGLLNQLDGYLKRHPEQTDKLSAEVENQFRSGRIPPQIHDLLTGYIAKARDGQMPVEEDKTRLKSQQASTPIRPEESSTEIFAEQTAVTPTQTATKPAGRPMVDDVLNHRFVLEQEIGRGGMGIVYMARDLRKEEAMDREPHVAVKVLNSEFHQNPEAFIALQRECKKAQRLAHPNIATVYDFDRDHDTVYMTMELLEGESIEHLLKRLKPCAMPFTAALPIITGMAQGLAYAHEQGIVHSDFKPGNAFVLEKGNVKVLDFGIARAVTRPGQTAKDATVFKPTWEALTPAYASCEMFEQAPPDPRDDIYALACVAYELLAGHHPFDRLPANQARGQKRLPEPIPALTRKQNMALAHALDHNRNQRTPSATQFLAEISDSGTGLNKTILTWAAALILAGLTIAVGFSFFTPPPAPTPPYAAPSVPAQAVKQPEINPPPVTKRLETEPPSKETALDSETLARIDRVLEMADLHRMIGRLTEPQGSNAFEAYQSVLEIQPSNTQAREGMEKIAEHYLQMAQGNFEQGNLKLALSDVEYGLKLFPNQLRLMQLKNRIAEQMGNQ